MQSTFLYLAYISVILLIGIILTILSKKIRISNVLLLVLAGVVLGNLAYKGKELIIFESSVLAVIGVFALVLIIFDECSRLKLHTFDNLSFDALKLASLFLVLNMLILTIIMHNLCSVPVAIAAIFAAAMSGTDPSSAFTILKQAKAKVYALLEIESIINTPLMVLIPFFIVSIMQQPSQPQIISYVAPFAQQFITGMGAGLLVALIIFKIAAKRYNPLLSPIAFITAALLSYVLAEYLHGSGVLAVTTFALFLGNIHLKYMEKVHEFSEIFTLLLELLVFILIGVVIKMPLTSQFFKISLVLFAAFVGIRFLSVYASFSKQTFTFREKMLMTFTMPKGISTAVVILALSTIQIPMLKQILDISLAFIIYSIILASITITFVKVEK